MSTRDRIVRYIMESSTNRHEQLSPMTLVGHLCIVGIDMALRLSLEGLLT